MAEGFISCVESEGLYVRDRALREDMHHGAKNNDYEIFFNHKVLEVFRKESKVILANFMENFVCFAV